MITPRLSAIFVAVLLFSATLGAAPVRLLFPTSLHLTREVHDPLTRTSVTMEEYCYGNRVVSITENRTVIVDYDKQEVTEIDRSAGTYSVTPFSEIASATLEMAGAGTSVGIAEASAQRQEWTVTPMGTRAAPDGRSLDQFEIVDPGKQGRKVHVGIDRSVSLSREAFEVLTGSAYPNVRRDEHAPLLRAAEARGGLRGPSTDSAAPSEGTYGLPMTQAFTYGDSGAEVTFRITVTRVGSEMPPSELLIIPSSSKRVESRATAVRRQLRELDQPLSPSASPRN